nr:unnamed protein product [Callosobruchus analis]
MDLLDNPITSTGAPHQFMLAHENCTVEQYTPIEHVEIVQLYIQNNFSIVKSQRAWRNSKKVKSAPSNNTIKRLQGRFLSSGTVANPRRPNNKRPRRSEGTITAVQATNIRCPSFCRIRNSSNPSMPHTSRQFEIIPV